jgi:hypothetical protein
VCVCVCVRVRVCFSQEARACVSVAENMSERVRQGLHASDSVAFARLSMLEACATYGKTMVYMAPINPKAHDRNCVCVCVCVCVCARAHACSKRKNKDSLCAYINAVGICMRVSDREKNVQIYSMLGENMHNMVFFSFVTSYLPPRFTSKQILMLSVCLDAARLLCNLQAHKMHSDTTRAFSTPKTIIIALLVAWNLVSISSVASK